MMATKKEPDGEHPPSHYLVVEDAEHPSTWHLRVRDADGSVNHNLMGAAWAALHGGYRGNKYEGPGKDAALGKLKALYKSQGMELPDTTGSEGVQFHIMLREPPKEGLIRIPIAITGKWKGGENEFSVTLDDLNEIRENFVQKPTGEINVDYEHASEVPFGTGGPVISAGKVTKLDAPEAMDGTGKHILWGWYEPTARARELIANKEYRYISPAIRWGAKDKVSGKAIGTVLTSVALVNKPFLEELPQLHLSEAAGEQKILVSLGQLHVPGPVNQISVAYGQPGSHESGGKTMAKSFRLKCLTAADVEKHKLPPDHVGKIGVFDGDEHVGTAAKPDGWDIGDGNGNGAKSSEVFATEVGMAGKSVEEIAAMVRRGISAAGDNGETARAAFCAEIGMAGKSAAEVAAMIKRGKEARRDLSELFVSCFSERGFDNVAAGRLLDQGVVKYSEILIAQDADSQVQAAVRAGKVLPKDRTHALKLALSDLTAFTALIASRKPVVDLRTHGHADGGERPTAQQVLMGEVNTYAKENKVSVAVALSEVTKLKPELWQQYSEEIVATVEATQEEE
jgi:hypothetical protein